MNDPKNPSWISEHKDMDNEITLTHNNVGKQGFFLNSKPIINWLQASSEIVYGRVIKDNLDI